LLIRDDRLKFTERNPLGRVLSVFPQVIAALPVFDHKAALADYARDYGLTVAEQPRLLKITGSGSGELTATFDDRGRLTSLVGTGVAPPKPPAPPRRKPAKKAKPAAAKKPAPKAAKTV